MNTINPKSNSDIENVLASIRQAISDDIEDKSSPAQSNVVRITPKPPQMTGQAQKISESEDILDLTNSLDEVPRNNQPQPHIRSVPEPEGNPIMSPKTQCESVAAFAGLNKLNQNIQKEISDGSFGQKTIEQLLQEILTPMLKEWLDSNLPSLIKWLVTEQIEKMSKQQQSKNTSL